MSAFSRLLLCLIALCATLSEAHAARLDDSASPRQRIDAKPRWQYTGEDALSPEKIGRMVVEVPNVEIRLDTRAWTGKPARIYLTLPTLVPGIQSPEGLRAEWRTRGGMAPGSLSPGGRVLVFDGLIDRAQIVEFFDFTLYLDSRFTQRGIRFEPKFDIEAR